MKYIPLLQIMSWREFALLPFRSRSDRRAWCFLNLKLKIATADPR